ncbi:DUF2306 domain-containing protein [Sphingomonas sp. LB-2]|uniref:DUF2306 domain-containing protein n=1 Tax=Sphingomonas caeni TaxID=2984949 RepID=UPI00222F6C10|nr:DUF2306 domain-containing protein [Sphingomonas caeni]MCW3846592.1 DUF2306 domain-containing protein [Sphingomonas caeni]
MATMADARDPFAPDGYERLLAIGALLLLVAVAAALVKGYPQWHQVPWEVWPHLLTILLAAGLTPIQLLRRRGDSPHRLLGTVWVLAMIATAAFSFNIRELNHGGLSPIHLLSVITLVLVPFLWWAAKTHRVALHRRLVKGQVTGALLIAGFFTFQFDRLLGHWLFG